MNENIAYEAPTSSDVQISDLRTTIDRSDTNQSEQKKVCTLEQLA